MKRQYIFRRDPCGRSREIRTEGAKGLGPFINKLVQMRGLSPKEARDAMSIIMSEGSSGFQQAAFLTALQMKEATAEEIAAFVFTLRNLSEPLGLEGIKKGTVIGDTCGTGGGTLPTFNISTAVMFILSACGIFVAKHGNRAVTSRSGSADVLEKLGVNIFLEASKARRCLTETGIVFLFAPLFHKAFRNVQEVRREIGIPTIFNILGPLLNPVSASDMRKVRFSQILGVNSPQLTKKIARVLRLMRIKRAMVVYGFDADGKRGMDEISTLGRTQVCELQAGGKLKNYELIPERFDFAEARACDLTGGTAEENAVILKDILTGRERGPKRDIVLLNAAAGLYIGNKADDIEQGILLATEALDSGEALKKLEILRRVSNRL